MRKTVWHSGAIPPEDERIAPLLKVWLPIFDAILFAFGVLAILFGSPIFELLFIGPVSVVFGSCMALSSLSAFIGLAFRFQRWEVASKIVLMMVFALFPFFLLLGTVFSLGRLAVGVLCLLPIPVLMWRIGDVGRQKGKGR